MKSSEPSLISEERISRLREHLQSIRAKHDKRILQEPTLKDAHIYCILHHISGQQFGPLIERYIITKNRYIKNSASECIGDCSTASGQNIEIKASMGGSTYSKFNYVQIRISHEIQFYIFTAYHLVKDNVERGGDLYIFYIPKSSMIELIATHGSYAHGTIQEHGKITFESILLGLCPENCSALLRESSLSLSEEAPVDGSKNLDDSPTGIAATFRTEGARKVDDSGIAATFRTEGARKVEYALRPIFGSDCWNALLPFQVDEEYLACQS